MQLKALIYFLKMLCAISLVRRTMSTYTYSKLFESSSLRYIKSNAAMRYKTSLVSRIIWLPHAYKTLAAHRIKYKKAKCERVCLIPSQFPQSIAHDGLYRMHSIINCFFKQEQMHLTRAYAMPAHFSLSIQLHAPSAFLSQWFFIKRNGDQRPN